jgi:hypothetical protein
VISVGNKSCNRLLVPNHAGLQKAPGAPHPPTPQRPGPNFRRPGSGISRLSVLLNNFTSRGHHQNSVTDDVPRRCFWCRSGCIGRRSGFAGVAATSALPRKQTSFDTIVMSALCQKRTHAMQQTAPCSITSSLHSLPGRWPLKCRQSARLQPFRPLI